MAFKYKCCLAGAMVVAVMLAWGCSDETITTMGSGDLGTGPASYYFPLTEGYSTQFEVFESDGSTSVMTFEVGQEVPFKTSRAVEWFVTHGSAIDTGYVEVTSDAVYFWEDAWSSREKILQMPLEAGRSWFRFEEYDYTQADESDNQYWYGNDGQDKPADGTDNDALNKNFPTTGSNQVEVVSVETLQLESGQVYSGSIRLATDGTGGTTNYFWFAPGVGLVKYVLGATGRLDDGREKAELVNYGYSE